MRFLRLAWLIVLLSIFSAHAMEAEEAFDSDKNLTSKPKRQKTQKELTLETLPLPLKALPKDILKEVFSYLSYLDIGHWMQVSKAFNLQIASFMEKIIITNPQLTFDNLCQFKSLRSVQFTFGNAYGFHMNISHGAFLTSPTRLQALSFHGVMADSGILQIITSLTGLTTLDLPHFSDQKEEVFRAGMRLFTNLNQLQSLSFPRTKENIHPAHCMTRGLLYVLEQTPFSQLTSLSLENHCKIVEVDFMPLTTILGHLKELDLGKTVFYKPEHLKNFTQLTSLNLRYTDVKDDDLRTLSLYVTGLTTLNLEDTKIQDTACLGRWTDLQNLNLEASKYLTSFEGVRVLTNLESLNCSYNYEQEADFHVIAYLIKLNRLDLRGASSQGDTFQFISSLSRLSYLNLSENTTVRLTYLSGLNNLKTLDLSLVDKMEGKAPSLTRLTTLFLGDQPFRVSKLLPLLESFPSLTHLDVSRNKRLKWRDAFVLLKGRPLIKTLNLSEFKKDSRHGEKEILASLEGGFPGVRFIISNPS